jgi:hypothetical protein
MFTTFQELVEKFQELFQVKIDLTELLKEYYSLQQQGGKSIAEFLLRFRAVQAMLDTPLVEDIQKQQFLKALREPLRSSYPRRCSRLANGPNGASISFILAGR